MGSNESSVPELVYRSVAEQRRQYVLSYLRDASDGTAALDDLVDYIVRQETDSPAPDRESVKIDLYHVYLPLLADAGALDFDTRTQMVRYRSGSSIERFLEDRLDRDADKREIMEREG